MKVNDIEVQFEKRKNLLNLSQQYLPNIIIQISEKCIISLKNGCKILFFGNGGSAADATHISAELVGRFKKDRKAYASLALNTDTSVLTAVGNDYGFDKIFSRQIEAISKKGDVVIGMSTSGTSENVLNGLKVACKMDCITILLTGKNFNYSHDFIDIVLKVPSEKTDEIQELHLVCGHLLCEIIEKNLG